MLIVCKVEGCPYRSKNSFCRNRVTAINSHGSCSHIYNENGSVKSNWQQPIDIMFMDGYKPPETQQKLEQTQNEGETA